MPVNHIIIKYKPSAGLESATAAGAATQMQRLSDAAGITLTYFRPMSGGAHVLLLPQRMEISRVQKICDRIAALPDVEYAEPDYVMRAIGKPAEGM
jgi:serine protease